MKIESILLSSRNSFSFCHLQKISTLLLMIITGVFLSSCSYLQNSTDSNLERQIEFQQVQQDLLLEPDVVEHMTVAECEELGDSYMVQGDINRAYLYYVKGLDVEPDKPSLLHKQGTLLLKKNKYAVAEQVFRRLLKLDVKDALAHEGLGKTYFGQGKFMEAEQNFLVALAIRPDLWQAHDFLGLIESSRRQDYPKAIKHFKRALTQKPGRVSISNNLAVAYYLNGNFDDAVRVLRELPATTNQKIYNNLALAYFQLGFYQNAMASFKKGTENEAAAYNNMGYEYLSVKKYSEAIEALEKAIDLHPKYYPSAQKNLNLAQRELSNTLAKAEN